MARLLPFLNIDTVLILFLLRGWFLSIPQVYADAEHMHRCDVLEVMIAAHASMPCVLINSIHLGNSVRVL